MFMTNALMPAWCQAIPRTYADILKAIYQGAFLCKKSIVGIIIKLTTTIEQGFLEQAISLIRITKGISGMGNN